MKDFVRHIQHHRQRCTNRRHTIRIYFTNSFKQKQKRKENCNKCGYRLLKWRASTSKNGGLSVACCHATIYCRNGVTLGVSSTLYFRLFLFAFRSLFFLAMKFHSPPLLHSLYIRFTSLIYMAAIQSMWNYRLYANITVALNCWLHLNR